jgi:hypothetical protein
MINYNNEFTYESYYKIFPLSLKDKPIFECGPGWRDILFNFLEDMEILIKDKYNIEDDLFPSIIQIKEKYGTLRIYPNFYPDELDDMIEDVELKSSKICEVCGNPGRLIPDKWMRVRCKDCQG